MRRTPRGAALALLLVATVASGAAAQPRPDSTLGGPTLGGPALGGPALATSGVAAGLGVPAPPAVKAASYVLADAGTGAVLAAKGPHARRPPASTLKTLMALTLLPRLDPGARYRAVHADAAVEGSKVGIVPGWTYSLDLLWRGLFLRSGNDTANALANAAGGVQATVALMRAEAARLQALDTTVANPSGLDAPGQLSSAYDLALFARAGLARVDFRGYCGMLRSKFPGQKQPFQIDNQNALLRNYPGAIGVKTGFTTDARHTLVGAATRGGRTLVVTLMRVPHPYVSKEAAALLDWGFAHAGQAQPVGALVDPVAATDRAGGPGGEVLESAGPVAVPTATRQPGWLPATGVAVAGLGAVLLALRTRRVLRRRRQST